MYCYCYSQSIIITITDPILNLTITKPREGHSSQQKEIQMRKLLADCRGVTMIEYALIAGLVAVTAIGILGGVGGRIKNLFTTINNGLTSA